MQSTTVSTGQLEAAIAEIDLRLVGRPREASLLIDRGQFLELLGRKDEAVRTYIDVLRFEPTNVDALNALGLLTLATGNRDGARVLLRGAVLHGPAHAAAHANLAYLSVLDGQHAGARALYEKALELEPRLAIAHHGLAQLLHTLGDEAGAMHHRSLGLHYRPLTIERYVGTGVPVRVLALGTEVQGNIPTYGYFDNRLFLLASLTVEHADPELPLPPHDLVFNAIGEADLCAEPLRRAAAIVRRTDKPVVNHPDAVAATSRASNARRLRAIAGVVTPRIAAFARTALTGPGAAALLADHGFTFPLLVRSPGYHTGDHFSKVDRPDALAGAVAELPGDELLALEFIDVRDRTEHYRKYRAIIVDGRLYPLHLAVSRSWKVHYFSADMAERPDFRAQDAAFLADIRAVIGAGAYRTLERVRDELGLDFGGIDFALDGGGNVIVFEANASMIVPIPDRDPIWDYRRAPVARIRAAVRDMLVRRAPAPPASAR